MMLDILVIDDDPLFADFLKRLLVRQGHRPVGVDSASDAVRILQALRFDLIITDVVMPEMDGIEFIRALNTMSEPLPAVIAVTGSGLNENGTIGRIMRALGATAVLAKPLELKALESNLAQIAAQRPEQEHAEGELCCCEVAESQPAYAARLS